MNTVDRIPIDSVLPGQSPRFGAEDENHIRRLAETDAELPAIVVHRSTMRVIDGMHRLRAAHLKGERTIAVEFFDGTDAAAYILGVQANVTHGLPLSLAERKEAARRIVALQPELADRAVAQLTGLAAATVSAIRKRAGAEELGARLGRDGRLRPVNADEGRRRAVEVIREYPDASLREIAQAARVSLGTAHDIRARLERGEDPVQRGRTEPAEPAPSGQADTPGTAGGPAGGEAANGEHRAAGAGRGLGAAAMRAAAPADGWSQGPDGTRPQPALPAMRRIGAERPGTERATGERPASRRGGAEAFAGLESLRRDPSLRFTDHGRALLVWLHRRLVVVGEAESELRNIPPHLLPVVAELAEECSDIWRELALELHYRARQIG
ncbi:hypothetical protein GCM10009665_65290 [Kitasatospora nipponensis]|uniref:ParB-like N-terminal domain-containing protein n=1 Tax=Kitasatospora nipponensis TaxID=258049 RepID=A0ABP4HHX2_9ACTN